MRNSIRARLDEDLDRIAPASWRVPGGMARPWRLLAAHATSDGCVLCSWLDRRDLLRTRAFGRRGGFGALVCRSFSDLAHDRYLKKWGESQSWLRPRTAFGLQSIIMPRQVGFQEMDSC